MIYKIVDQVFKCSEMQVRPYNDTEPKKEQVRKMFDGIAPRYDRLNHLLSLGIDRGWRRRTVKEVRRHNPGSILDVATGTGDLAILMAKKLPEASVTGADLSEGMLEIARQKAGRQVYAQKIEFICTEAEKLPFADNTFEAVTAAFGVRNFHDIEGGLAEMARVLKPRGRLFVLEFSTPRNKIFGALYRFYFHRILPRVGGWISGDKKAYAYLPGSVDHFPEPEEFGTMLEKQGLTPEKGVTFLTGVARLFIARKD